MKTRIFVLILTCLFAGGVSMMYAQKAAHGMSGHEMNKSQSIQVAKQDAGKTDSVKVMGNCGHCKTRIEKAAMSVKGVKSASWDKQTKILHLAFTGDNKTAEVQEAVAKAGHDTGTYKAATETYNTLPGCCRYRDK